MARRYSKIIGTFMRALASNCGLPAVAFPCFTGFWFKLSASNGISELITWNNDNDTQYRRFYLNGATLYVAHKGYDNPTEIALNLGTITLNKWHFVWGYFGSTTSFSGQLDAGSVKSYGGYSGEFNDYTEFNVGNRADFEDSFDGDLANIGVWNVNLNNIYKELLQKGVSLWNIAPENMVALYPMWGAYNISGSVAIEQNLIGNHLHYLESTGPYSEIPQSPHPQVATNLSFFAGNSLILAGNVEIIPTGIITEETFGNSKLNLQIIPTGIITDETFGNSKLNLQIRPLGIITDETFGNSYVIQVQTVITESILTVEEFGFLSVNRGNYIINVFSIVSVETFGIINIQNAGFILKPTGIITEETFGNSKLNLQIIPTGIISDETFGNSLVLAGNINLVPLGIVSNEFFGNFDVSYGNVDISVEDVTSSETFGNLSLHVGSVGVGVVGIPSVENFGNSALHVGNVNIVAENILTEEAFGVFDISINIKPDTILSVETFGAISLQFGGVNVGVGGITSNENIGSSIVRNVLIIEPFAIDSTEFLGLPSAIHFIKNPFQEIMCKDIDSIFDGMDEFSENCIIIHSRSKLTYSIPVIFDNEYLEQDTGAFSSVMARQPMITCKDRFREKPTRGDMFIIRGFNYTILTYEPDGTGVAVLQLKTGKTNV